MEDKMMEAPFENFVAGKCYCGLALSGHCPIHSAEEMQQEIDAHKAQEAKSFFKEETE